MSAAAPTVQVDLAGGRRQRAVRILRDYAIAVVFVGLFLVLSITVPAFLSSANLLNVLDRQASLAIVAAGMTVVIVSGGFDLSAGAIFAASGLAAVAVANHTDPVLGILAAVVVGGALGLINGALITVGRMHSFLATLASSLVFRGLSLVIVGAGLVVARDVAYQDIARSTLFSARSDVFVAAAVVIAVGLLLQATRFGRAIYAVGGNADAARVAGLRVQWVRAAAMVVSGACAGLAGMVESSRVGGAQVSAGVGLEFTAITAVVLGGTSVYGGEGTMGRTVVGVLLLGLIANGFNLSNVDPVYQQFVVGGVLLAAIGVDARTHPGR